MIEANTRAFRAATLALCLGSGDDFYQLACGAVVVADVCAAISIDGIGNKLVFDID